MTPAPTDATALHTEAAALRQAGEDLWHHRGIRAALNAIAIVNMAEALMDWRGVRRNLDALQQDVAVLHEAASVGGADPEWLGDVMRLWRDSTAGGR